MKIRVIIVCLLSSIIIIGCSERKIWQPRSMKLQLNNFQVNDIPPNNNQPDLNFKFFSYAKECAYGIAESGEKLAVLYQQTLNVKNPNYLYFQQYPFSNAYNYCLFAMKDNAQDKEDSLYAHALQSLTNAKPKDPNLIIDIIYYYYNNNDITSANQWSRELNLSALGDAKGNYLLGKFLFEKTNTQEMGYKLVENAAKLGNLEALDLLESTKYHEYRSDNPILKKNYFNIIHGE